VTAQSATRDPPPRLFAALKDYACG